MGLYDGTSLADKYDYLDRHTQSLFCPASNLITYDGAKDDSL